MCKQSVQCDRFSSCLLDESTSHLTLCPVFDSRCKISHWVIFVECILSSDWQYICCAYVSRFCRVSQFVECFTGLEFKNRSLIRPQFDPFLGLSKGGKAPSTRAIFMWQLYMAIFICPCRCSTNICF